MSLEWKHPTAGDLDSTETKSETMLAPTSPPGVAPPALASLPVEILLLINELLADTHPPSLLSLAVCSASFYAAAKSQLFRFFKFKVDSQDGLQRDVQMCEDILSRNAAFHQIRILAVTGMAPEWTSASTSWRRLGFTPWEDGTRDDSVFPTDIGLNGYNHDVENARDIEAFYRLQPAWSPLVELMIKLHNLTDIRWDCSDGIPPALLTALHTHLPKCRLHISEFWLQSSVPPLAAHELSLVRSPCLTSIRPSSAESYETGLAGDVIVSLAASVTPNLERVVVKRCPKAVVMVPNLDMRLHQEPDVPATALHHRKAIKSFGIERLRHADDMNKIWHAWQSRIDLFQLQTLILETPVPEPCLQSMTVSRFLNLTTLTLYMHCDHLALGKYDTLAIEQGPVPHTYHATVELLLLSIPPLTNLRIRGHLDRLNLDLILTHHGRRLVDLIVEGPWLDSRLSSWLVNNAVARFCRRVQRLGTLVRRSKGDAAEVAVYRRLGTLPRLTVLHLSLDAQPHKVSEYNDNDLGFSDNTNDSLQGSAHDLGAAGSDAQHTASDRRLRDAFINAALDESLASAIFATISKSKPAGGFPLRELKVGVSSGTSLGESGASVVSKVLGSTWVLKRDPRDDRVDVIHAHNLPRLPAVTIRYARRLNPRMFDILRQIWPLEEPKQQDWRDCWRECPSDWMDRWHSFPLTDEVS